MSASASTGGKPATAAQISFESFTKLVDTLVRTPQKNGKKVKTLRRFCDQYVPRADGNDLFHFYRLLLPSPQVEKERGNYQLKEAKLAAVLADAVGASAADVERAKQWRLLNSTRSGVFHEVMYEVLFRKYLRDPQQADPYRAPLTLEEVNAALEELVLRGGDSGGQQALLRALLQRCSPGAARVLVLILMKDLKMGMSADTVLFAYHPDAPGLMNSCMDLRKVLTDLLDPTTRVKKKDVVPGQPAKPQLADRCDGGVAVAARRMRGKKFVVEVKFDGERMQVHRTGPDSFNFFSRRGLDHGSKRDFAVLGPALASLMNQERMILDGEMVVWNKTRQVFEPFGGLSSALDAINRRAGPTERIKMKMGTSINTSDPDYVFPTAADVEVIYVAFDVLFIDDGSVLDKPLGERHQLLRRALRSCPPEGIPVGPTGLIRFRALPLLPGAVMLGGEVYSKEGTGVGDIKDMYERALAKQEEGIVVKALDSPYKLNDRSGAWLKVKPDYVDSSEFDAVVIGATWGTGGRRGGRLSEYLLALADHPRVPGAEPSTFVSFCRVGTGLNAEQSDLLRELLQPLLVELGQGQGAPRCYRLTGHPRERPDVWVREPLRSVVLTVKADVRTIVSDTFASRYSLRFPRVVALRQDRSARDVNTLAELERMVLERARSIREGADGQLPGAAAAVGGFGARDGGGGGGGGRDGGAKRRRAGAPNRGGPSRIAVSKVPLELRPVDVSHVEVEVDVLRGRYVLLRDLAPEQRRQLAALVKKLGGVETQNYVPSGPQATSYVIVGKCDPDRIRFDPFLAPIAARMDLLRPEWLQRVSEQRVLIDPARPSLAWSISGATREKYSAVMDPYGDAYFEVLCEEDLEAVLSRHITAEQLAEARRRLEEAAALPARTRRRRRQQDARRQPDGRTSLYETTDDIVRRIRDEIHDIGEKLPPGSMFLGLTLLFLEMHDIPPPPAPAPRAVAPMGLLTGVTDCQARAHAAAASDPRNRVETLKAAVVRHGGVVVDSWDERVTHLILYDGLDERDEQLWQVLNAERECFGLLPALPRAAHVVAGSSDGVGGVGAASSAAGIAAAAREYSPEEVIEALIGVAECPDDEDAAEEGAEQSNAGGGSSRDGDGKGLGGASGAATSRRWSREQARCLSLIRAALERPRGAVEAVGAVQLVDWRWVRDSLQRAAELSAVAAEAGARRMRAAERGLLFGTEYEEDDEEEQLEAADAVGTLSELDYPPRIRPPEEWLQQQLQQQTLLESTMEVGAETIRPAAAAGLTAMKGDRGLGLGGSGMAAAIVHPSLPLPPPSPPSIRRMPGGTNTALGSIWRAALDWDSDESDSVCGTAAGYEGDAPPVAASASAAPPFLSAAHEVEKIGDCITIHDQMVAAPLVREEAPISQPVASQIVLPPPDEFIRWWPWERFHIDLPSAEELARIGTHQRRRRRHSDGVEGSTDGITSGGGTIGCSTGGGSGSGGCGQGSVGRGQRRSAELSPPPPQQQPSPSPASPKVKAHGASGRRRASGVSCTLSQRRQRKGAVEESLPAEEDEQQCRAQGEVKEDCDTALPGSEAVNSPLAEISSSPVVPKASKRCDGSVRKVNAKGSRGAAPQAGWKRAAPRAAATCSSDKEDAEVSVVNIAVEEQAEEEEETVARGRPKRPRRAAAVAAAAAALAVDEQEDTWSPPLAAAESRGTGQRRRRRPVQVGASDEEGPIAIKEPATGTVVRSVAAGEGGGDGGEGSVVFGAAVSRRRLVTPDIAPPIKPSKPGGRNTDSKDGPVELLNRRGGEAEAVRIAPNATTTATGATTYGTAVSAPGDIELPPQLRKRRLKDLVAAPYSVLACPASPGADEAGAGASAATPSGYGGSGAVPHSGLDLGLRRLDSPMNVEDRQPTVLVSELGQCRLGLGGVSNAATETGAAPTALQQQPPGLAAETGAGLEADKRGDLRTAQVGGDVTASRPTDPGAAGAVVPNEVSAGGRRNHVVDVIRRILEDSDEDC